MLKILGRSSSINVQKVMWCAAELGAEVERIDIGGKYGGNDTPEYLAKNPNGLVPTMEDGEVVLWESNTIVRYLAETRGSQPWFASDAAGRGLASQWMDWYLTRLHHLAVSQDADAPTDRLIDVLVSRIRKKIEKDSKKPEIITTVVGCGYKFSAQLK